MVVLSAFVMAEALWHLCFVVELNAYLAIIMSKNVYKSPAIQNNSIILLSVIMAVIVHDYLFFSIIKKLTISANHHIYRRLHSAELTPKTY